ncbi:MAG TPA: dUTP diphosphatase [Oligoflexia bacterium]|nr:dUTP diphosphatase [Oligoflexia bacterium]HMP26460.1 dUTP diphosphatase [Oligoflexia bacterium]
MKEQLLFFLTPAAKQAGIIFTTPRSGDAGFDLRALEEAICEVNQSLLIPTGLKLKIPNGWVGVVKDRSSMALRGIYTHGGVIDSSYRGEIKVVISNRSNEPYQIKSGDKIAQLLVVPYCDNCLEVSDENELGLTDRGADGFGSTGR